MNSQSLFSNVTWRSTISTSERADLKRIIFLWSVFLTTGYSTAQQSETEFAGIHQVQSEYYSKIKEGQAVAPAETDLYPLPLKKSALKNLTARVLGWHPYWASSGAFGKYYHNALTHIAYFSYETDTATGGYTTIRDWNTTPIISQAHEQGIRVILTVTNFGTARNTELLTDTVKQVFLINNVINLLKNRNGDGVNFDLESVPSSLKENTVRFISRAVTMIRAQLPEAEISMATPAVDWSGAWDLARLAGLCDYLIVMGYDYYWRGSSTAGPVAPLEGEPYNVTRTINTYLSEGVPPSKLMLGVPWYGYDWPVTGSARKAPSTGNATARTYSSAENIAGMYGSTFDPAVKVPWTAYQGSSGWRQMWYDDPESLIMKYNLAKSKNLAGIGIWALSYEDGSPEMWNSLYSSFSANGIAGNTILQIYPNPAAETFTIVFTLAEKEKVTLELFTILGKKIMSINKGSYEQGSYIHTIACSGLSPGVYICVLKAGSSVSSEKIIIGKKNI